MARHKYRKRPATPAVHSDYGTPERWQKGPIRIDRVVEEGLTNRDVAIAAHSDDPLYVYHRRKTITKQQYAAGVELRVLRYDAVRGQSVTSGYCDAHSGGTGDLVTVLRVDKYKEYQAAIRAIGQINSWPTISVVIHEQILPNRSPKIDNLRAGLDNLIKFFGY